MIPGNEKGYDNIGGDVIKPIMTSPPMSKKRNLADIGLYVAEN